MRAAVGEAWGAAAGRTQVAPLPHRADIDGLRAVAIVPILLLHCGLARLRGGFVGVDIFFVISGFLITRIVVGEIAAGRFSLVTFYRRRIVRILPALAAMMTIVLAVGAATLLPNQLRDLGRSTVATALFGSNIYFHATADYFAASSDAKPLIHTWSLAVEEQFYLLYPLLLAGARHLARRRLAAAVALVAAASFAIGGWWAATAPSAGFFLLPARIWELSLGALVALEAAPALRSARWRAALCCAALAVIAASCVAISDAWPFPVPLAVPPVVAAAILIAYGEHGPSARLLSWPGLRAIGLISYSLYLWHRPIIAFYQIVHGATLRLPDTVLLLAASFAAAGLSYRLVERPAGRRWRSAPGLRPHGVAALTLLTLAMAGWLLAADADRVRPLPPQLARIAGYLGFDATAAGRAQFGTDRCFALPTGARFDPACLALARDRRNIVLMGDSHGAHLSQALRLALPGVRIVQATAAGCRPLLAAKGPAACRAVMAAGFRAIDPARVVAVLLSARWLRFEEPALRATIAGLRARGVGVVVVGPSIEYDVEMPTLLVRAALAGDPGMPARYRLVDRIALDGWMAHDLAGSGARYVSEVAIECPRGACRLLASDGAPFHFDHSHLTPGGAHDVVAALVAARVLERPVTPVRR